MATSGSFQTTFLSGFTLKGSWTDTPSTPNNTSTIKVTVSLTFGSGYGLYIGTRTVTVTINGTAYTFTSPAISTEGNTTITLGSVTSGAIKHNSDGSISPFTISISFPVKATIAGTYYSTWSTSGTCNPSTIPRASTVSSFSVDLTAKTVKVSISRADSSFTHSIHLYTESTSNNLWAKALVDKTNATGGTFTLTDAEVGAICTKWPNTTTVPFTVYVRTYKGNDTVGDWVAKGCNATVPSYVLPSIESIAIEEGATSGQPFEGVYVQGLSKFKIKATGAGAYGSTIKTYRIAANGETTSNATGEYTTGLLGTNGDNTVTVKVTDSRGRTASASVVVSVYAYSKPTITEVSSYRVKASDHAPDDEGPVAAVTVKASIYPVNNLNTHTWLLKYKKTVDTAYSSQEITTDGYTLDTVVYIDADVDYSWDIVLEATDLNSTNSRATVLSTGFTLVDLKNGGTGIAIGKAAEHDNLMEVALPSQFNSMVLGNVLGLGALKEIPEGSDLNGYKEFGGFSVPTDDRAEGLINCPSDLAGVLIVSSANGAGNSIVPWSYIRQQYIPYLPDRPGWERLVSCGADATVWTYGQWYMLDRIIESGTSGVWTYEKWASGKAELWGTTTHSTSLSTKANTSYSTPYYYSAVLTTPEFPFSVVAGSMLPSIQSAHVGIWTSSNGAAASTTAAKFRLNSTIIRDASTYTVYWHIKARWR